MEARILKWREMAKTKQTSAEEFEAMQHEIKQRDAEIMKDARINQLIREIPLRFRGKTMDDFHVECEEQDRVKRVVERFIETSQERIEAGTPVQFMGKPGTGKTLLSLIMYQALAKQGYSVKYEPSLEFLKELLEIKFKSQTNFNRHIEALRNINFFVIDEVTESVSKHGSPSEIEKQLLFRIINDRYENNLSTLVITNRDEAGMVASLGETIVDRLREKGIALAFNWNSYRKYKG